MDVPGIIQPSALRTASARDRDELGAFRGTGAVSIVVGLTPGRVPYRLPETSGSTRVVSSRFVELAHRVGIAVQV